MPLSSPTMTLDASCCRCGQSIKARVEYSHSTPARSGGATLHMRCPCWAIDDSSACDDPRYGRGVKAFYGALNAIVRRRIEQMIESSRQAAGAGS